MIFVFALGYLALKKGRDYVDNPILIQKMKLGTSF